MLTIHFDEKKSLKYEKQVVFCTEKILLFLQNIDIINHNYETMTEMEIYFYRIYNMLYCEKEYLFYTPSIRGTRMHISFDIFRPLIEKIKYTKEYEEYKLEELFKEYKKCMTCF